MRALFNRDIATGLESTGEGSNYSSEGPGDTLEHRNEQFEQPLQFCYTLDPGSTCTEEQIESLLEGNVTVCRYIVKDENSTVLFPELMGRLEDEGCGNGSAGNGNGTVGGGNGTVGGGVPVPSEGDAGRIAVSVGMIIVGLLAFVVL
jgi:hypothetical protein